MVSASVSLLVVGRTQRSLDVCSVVDLTSVFSSSSCREDLSVEVPQLGCGSSSPCT